MSVSIVVGEKLGDYQDLLLLDVGKYCCGGEVRGLSGSWLLNTVKTGRKIRSIRCLEKILLIL